MINGEGNGSRENGGTFMSNTRYMEKESTMIKGEGTL
jgi:hypothetical protein